MDLREVKAFLEVLNQEKVTFDPHFYKRTRERPVDESFARSFLTQINKLEKIEQGNIKDRFKLWFKMSSKYSLVLIVEINSQSLKVISAWNTHRKWQNQLRR
jgi:hypothetical protein